MTTDTNTDTNGPYTIMINENQRAYISKLLTNIVETEGLKQAESVTPLEDELLMLEGLFRELPEVAKDEPKNMVHGFCL